MVLQLLLPMSLMRMDGQPYSARRRVTPAVATSSRWKCLIMFKHWFSPSEATLWLFDHKLWQICFSCSVARNTDYLQIILTTA